jgi:hypothetical protein
MSERVLSRRWQLAIRLTIAALVWSIGLLLAALLLGSYSGQTVSSDAGVTLTTRTFVQVNGLSSLVLVAIPLLACLSVGVALWHRHHRQPAWSGPAAWTGVAVLALEAALGIATVGLFLIPVVVLLALSVRLVPGPVGPAAPAQSAASPAVDG